MTESYYSRISPLFILVCNNYSKCHWLHACGCVVYQFDISEPLLFVTFYLFALCPKWSRNTFYQFSVNLLQLDTYHRAIDSVTMGEEGIFWEKCSRSRTYLLNHTWDTKILTMNFFKILQDHCHKISASIMQNLKDGSIGKPAFV